MPESNRHALRRGILRRCSCTVPEVRHSARMTMTGKRDVYLIIAPQIEDHKSASQLVYSANRQLLAAQKLFPPKTFKSHKGGSKTVEQEFLYRVNEMNDKPSPHSRTWRLHAHLSVTAGSRRLACYTFESATECGLRRITQPLCYGVNRYFVMSQPLTGQTHLQLRGIA
ncbi:hypothetical protein EV681_3126 [Advenella incenata]|uniref:Uncharacterized protein n=1 Tax=Advenella incenata TaxID=267800 RepID=A0A4Q7VFN3_9BURK|nr:hypothetical protein EV681_3126 [Advenella incenata]